MIAFAVLVLAFVALGVAGHFFGVDSSDGAYSLADNPTQAFADRETRRPAA